ncbi:MAG: class I SAM-dependent methyltransferase [Phycisphaerae bacterium]
MSAVALLDRVDRYYSDKLRAAGATPSGVDWNSPEAQQLRFEQLLKGVDASRPFSILDYGCGYGALADFLSGRANHELPLPPRTGAQVRPPDSADLDAAPGQFADFSYCGYDISDAMIQTARKLHADDPRLRFTSDADELVPMDYAIASGVLNVTCGTARHEWERHVFETIDRLAKLGTRGFAFNALTAYADPDRRRADLYYADPCRLFDYCKRRWAAHVALLHDYGLYDFTILARTEGAS